MTDPAEREAAYKEITDYVLHNGPVCRPVPARRLFGVRNKVKGFEWNPMGFADFWSIVKVVAPPQAPCSYQGASGTPLAFVAGVIPPLAVRRLPCLLLSYLLRRLSASRP